MSPAWLTILCLFPTAMSGPEKSGVVWRNLGGDITIQCRHSASGHESLSLEKGLSQDQIFYKDSGSKEDTIAERLSGRVQLNGEFPNLDILIKNLTTEDTGPYWCLYKRYNPASFQLKTEKGNGSVLLVVTDQELTRGTTRSSEMPKCDSADKNLVLLSVVISAAILLGIIIGFLIWIVLKTKASRSTQSTVKPRRPATNDVYEDMRGTLRH